MSNQHKEEFKDWYINTSGQNYMPFEILWERIEKLSTPPSQTLGIEVDELKQIRETFQWTWDNMDMPHTSDHFNIPANGIAALDRLIAASQSSTEEEKDLWEEVIKEVERNEFLSTKYKEVIDNLQSKFKISKKMKHKVDVNTKKYTAFLTDMAQVLEKHKVKDLLIVANINGQIRNTYLPCTGVEDPLYCNLSDGIDSWLKLSGYGKRDETSFAIKNYPLG